jgi:hypothetical protein
LAIAPDGTAIAATASQTVENLPLTGGPTTLAIPSPSGTGFIQAVFDGTNGYVYAAIEDSFGTFNVVRISR